MSRLRQHIVDTTAITASTPTFGIGMSNGSAFVALWAEASTRAGQPVAAAGMYMAGPRKSLDSIGGLRVPTFMVIGRNDTITNPAKERSDLQRIAAAGVPTELHEVEPQPVTAARYLRIPGADETIAEAIVAAYRSVGVIDADGNVSVDLSISVDAAGSPGLPPVSLPATLTPNQIQEAGNETLVAMAEHQFNAESKEANVAFFDANH